MQQLPTRQEIACQQVLVEDGSVFSVQWSVMPVAIAAGLSPLNLLERYLAYIKKCTFSIIRPLVLNTGLEFRLLNTGWSLISFLPPQAGAGFATLRICGGLLVQPRQCGCGEFRFELDTLPEGVRVSLRLSDFCPLILGSSSPSALRFRLYQLTQATIHRRVAVRFLAQLYRELAGVSAEIKIVNVSIRDGKAV